MLKETRSNIFKKIKLPTELCISFCVSSVQIKNQHGKVQFSGKTWSEIVYFKEKRLINGLNGTADTVMCMLSG